MRIKCQKTLAIGALAASLAAMNAQAGLTHRYSFTSNANDSVGSANGTIVNPGKLAIGTTLGNYGTTNALEFSNFDPLTGTYVNSSDTTFGYVQFPGNLLGTATSVTVETWAASGFSLNASGGTWSRLFDFGNLVNGAGQNYIMLTPHAGDASGSTIMAVNTTDQGETRVTYPTSTDSAVPHHYVCVFDFANGFMELYLDGAQVGRTSTGTRYKMSTLGTNNMFIGRSLWGGDQYLVGSMDEFRVYDRALSGAEAMADFLAGSGTANPSLTTQLGSISSISFTDPGAMVERDQTNTVVTGVFDKTGTTGISLFNLANFTLTSSDTNVVKVNGGGALVAVKPGNATLTATYGGKSQTLPIVVNPDQVAPTVTGADNKGYDRLLEVAFSELLDPTTAQTIANYSIDSGAIAVKKATLLADGKTVRLITANFDQNASHTVVASNVKDTAVTANLGGGTANFGGGVKGTLVRKLWNMDKGAMADVLAEPRFPNDPDSTSTLTLFEGPTDTADHYFDAIEGYLIPSADGGYYFGIATDDDGSLFLSTDDNPANLPKTATASMTGWTGARNYRSNNGIVTTTPINLVGGQKYFFRFVHREGTGGDNEAVAWATDPAQIQNGTAPIPADNLMPYFTPAVAMAITKQPTNLALFQNQDATFSVAISSLPKYTSVQWYRNNTVISNATGLSYTLPLAQKANDGDTFFAVVSNLVDVVTSSIVTLNVTVDNTAPTLVWAEGSASGTTVKAYFSERVDPTSAATKGNYSIAGLTISSVALDTNTLTNVVITLSSPMAVGAPYVLTVSNVKDRAGNVLSPNPSTVSFHNYDVATGVCLAFYYDNYTAGADAILTARTNMVPTGSYLNSWLGTPTWGGDGHNNYAGYSEGWIVPPEDGSYTFFISSDDGSRFYLSSDATTANTNLICQVSAWANQREYTKEAGQMGTAYLTKGQKYYYIISWSDGTGGDGFNVGWETPSNPTNIVDVPGSALRVMANGDLSSVTVTNNPVSVTVNQGEFAVFTADGIGQSQFGNAITYQWQKNGVDIPGATAKTYTTPAATIADNNALFHCVISVPLKSATSADAKLTVIADKIVPKVVSAGAYAGSTQVGVRFSEFVDPTTAMDANNYTLAGNVHPTDVQYRTNADWDSFTCLAPGNGINGDMVILTVAPVADGTTVTIKNVKDLFGNVMVQQVVPVGISDLTFSLIGTNLTDPATIDPKLSFNSMVPCGSNAFQIIAGGSDFWGNYDAGVWGYKSVEGDFDARMRVTDLFHANQWSKTGLMVRETTDGWSRAVNMVLTPLTGDSLKCWQMVVRSAESAGAGDSPNFSTIYTNDAGRPRGYVFPNAWVRVTRAGQVITAYTSTNGTDWKAYDSVSFTNAPLGSSLYVGPAATGHDNNGTNYTTVDVFDFSVVPYTPVLTPPTITVSLSGTSVVLTWDATLGQGFKVVSADDPGVAVTGWADAGLTPTTADGKTSVTIPASAAKKFYRLKN